MAARAERGINALNQIYDLEIDRVNKPKRPLPDRPPHGERGVDIHAASRMRWRWCWPGWSRRTAAMNVSGWSLIAIIITFIYSAPPLRTKRLGIWANVTIAIPRGVLLKVAGWSSVKTMVGLEPWYIGAIFGLFLLGATTTKDFADMEGDRARRLPHAAAAVRRATGRLDDLAVLRRAVPDDHRRRSLGVLTGNFWLLQLLGLTMTAYGLYVCYLMLRRPEEFAVEENHVSWAHMYRMMFVAQVGFALAYLL